MKKFLIFFSIVALFGCKKFLDVNVNPNTATDARADYVFTNGQNTSGAIIVGTAHQIGSDWAGLWAHSTSFTGGGELKTYQFTNQNFNLWSGLYDNLNDYQFVINNAAADQKEHLIGPAKVMQAMMWQRLVDVYGDAPYVEALKGSAFPYAKYSDDQFIYEDIIKVVDTAISLMKSQTWPSGEVADIYFQGNKTRWLQFANTVKLRILMRQSFMPGRDGYITTEINKIVSEGSGFITAHVLSNPGYLKSIGKLNQFYANWGYNENDVETGFRFNKLNSVLINFLKNTSDQFRLQRIATPKVGGVATNPADYVGIPLGGGGSAYLETLVSSIGSEQIVKGDATRPLIIMSVAEAFFLKAEAAQRYNIAALGTAQSNYEDGVRWAFRLAAATHVAGATATDAQATTAANTYLASGQQFVDFTASTDKIRTILIQKWLALANIDGQEAWSDYRKSNGSSSGSVPTTPKSVAVSASQQELVRLYYPFIEKSTNPENYKDVNIFTDRIFWDVN